MKRVLCIIYVLGCVRSGSNELGNEIGRSHVVHESISASPRFRTAMRHHYDDLREIGRLLRKGRLTDATTLAFWFSRPIEDPRVADWPVERARLTTAARQLSGARSLATAARLDASVAAACGDCHAHAGALAAFERDGVPPLDDGTHASQIQRHRWAADRVWDGVVGASESQWRAGLRVLALDRSAPALQAAATRAASGTDRGRAYADLLVTCTSCHPTR